MKTRPAARVRDLPSTLFMHMEANQTRLESSGLDIIDLSIGDPDGGSPAHVVEALVQAARDPANHRYPSGKGMPELRRAVAEWYFRRHRVRLDPEEEILYLVGIKEGISFAPLAFTDGPEDVVLVPTPGWTGYIAGTRLAGATPHYLPLSPKRDFLPDLDAVPADMAERARILFLNYPNNPTGAVATREFFSRAAEFARAHGTVVCHDAAYAEITYDGRAAPSFLETPGGREVGVEFFSLSKTFQMTGWRIGFVVGRAELLAPIYAVRHEIDSGVFIPIQHAAIAALDGPDDFRQETVEKFRKRRDLLATGLRAAGADVKPPQGTFYLWVAIPEGADSLSFSAQLAEQLAILTVPGTAFGPGGEGYVRFALTEPEARIAEAAERMARAGIFKGARVGHEA